MPISDDALQIIIELTGELVITRAKATSATLWDLISQMRASGMSKEAIRTRLITDLKEGGQVFGSLKSQFVSITNQSIERTANYAAKDIYRAKRSDATLFDWVLDPRIQNHCDDCIDRANGDARTLEEWELLGEPASGVTVCGGNCGCKLVPEKKEQEE